MNTNSRTAKSIARRKYGNGLIFIAAMAYSLASPAEQLPVFKLAEPKIDHGKASAILANLHGEEPDSTAKRGDKENIFLERAGSIEVEIYKASGGIFLRDTQRLWNRALKPKLPSRDEAKKFADRFLAENDLLPSEDQYIEVSFEGFSETGISSDTPGRVDKTILDIEANYQVDLVIEQTKDDQKFVVPVVGGGGDFKVAVGEGGRVIGFHGVWRPIAEVASIEEIMPKAEAEAKLKGTLGNAKATKIESFLAYYSAPGFEQQRFLAPVWVIQAEGKFGDMSGVQKVPLRTAIIAATKFGPEFPVIPPKERIRDDRIHDDATPLSSLDDEARKSFLDLLLPAAHAQNPFEAGTSWIGPSQGLGGSPANAQGFVDGLAGAGWNINFNWGEAAAWESDWNSSDDSWVDAVDFVFYTGHASSDGWVLNTPDDSFLHFNEVGATPGSPNDRYGQNDLEWIIIAACGPHQSSHFVGSVGNAFDRWRGIFDGLHVFLGYGAVTFDNTTEGSRVVELARAGWPIIDAWFRAAWEIQPSTNGFGAPNGPTIYVTAMYAHKGDHATRTDHIWGTGATVADPVNPGQQRFLMWSGT